MRRKTETSPWTEEAEQELRKLWSKGYSCAQIAALIGGMTRNAVIGKAHRLNLPSRDRKIFNVNGHTRFIDPTPRGTHRARHVGRSVVCKTVFKSRERKPRNDAFDRKPTPGLIQVFSSLTGYPVKVRATARQRQPEMTKSQLRAMLTAAVQNTATMESQA